VSSGLATFPEDGLHAEDLIARADEALYGAKHAGRNRVCVHYREKRAAVRFPVKSGTAVEIGGADGADAQAVNLSATGMLLDAGAPLEIAEPVVLRFQRTGPTRIAPDLAMSGRVVRVVKDPERPAHVHLGVVFDAPMPEDELMARVSLSRTGVRGARGDAP